MSEATGYETVDRKVAKNSYTPLQGWDDIRKVFELLRADENGALLVKGLADVTIGEISVDNVELIDSTGKKLLFTASGEIKAYASDGSLVTLGTTTDADTANNQEVNVCRLSKGYEVFRENGEREFYKFDEFISKFSKARPERPANTEHDCSKCTHPCH